MCSWWVTTCKKWKLKMLVVWIGCLDWKEKCIKTKMKWTDEKVTLLESFKKFSVITKIMQAFL